jgi:hypothetical protein
MISKLFGYDFTVEDRSGRLKTVVDALSHREQDGPTLAAISGPTFEFYADLRTELDEHDDLRRIRDTIVLERGEPCRVDDGLIVCGSRVYIPAASRALQVVLQLAHTNGHEGVQKTLQRLRHDFVVDHDRRVVGDFVRTCSVCQQNKTEALHPAGLLQPLDVPSQVWADISIDFVEGLPKLNGKSVISRSSTGFQSTRTSSPWDTPTPPPPSPVPSSTTLSGFMACRRPSSATVIWYSPAMYGATYSSWPASNSA